MKKCFTCKVEKPLSEFEVNRMKYQVKADLGTCIVCKECELAKAIKTLSVIKYDFEQGKFVLIKFNTENEVINYFKQNYESNYKRSIVNGCSRLWKFLQKKCFML